MLNEKSPEMPIKDYILLQKRNRNLNIIKEIFEKFLNTKKLKSKGKMFNLVTQTWNPVSGCLNNCKYCWARKLANTKLKKIPRYSEGFKPRLNENEFNTKFSNGDFVFVSDMGDLFSEFIPSNWIKKILDHVRLFPEAYFLLLTKNPSRYHEFILEMPKNVILGATIETNLDHIVEQNAISRAPLPSERYIAMKELQWDKKMLSIEPILDFDVETFSYWIENVFPFLVYIGYDNYNHKLPEPSLNKTMKLIKKINNDILIIKKTIRHSWLELEK